MRLRMLIPHMDYASRNGVVVQFAFSALFLRASSTDQKRTCYSRLETAAATMQCWRSVQRRSVVRRSNLWFDPSGVQRFCTTWEYPRQSTSTLCKITAKRSQKENLVHRYYCALTTPKLEKRFHLNIAQRDYLRR